jgi:hypothetical protein
MIAGRLALSAAVAVCGLIIATRVCVAAVASGSYGQAIPGVVLGGLLVAFGLYRIALVLRVRDARRR